MKKLSAGVGKLAPNDSKKKTIRSKSKTFARRTAAELGAMSEIGQAMCRYEKEGMFGFELIDAKRSSIDRSMVKYEGLGDYGEVLSSYLRKTFGLP